MMAGRGLQRPEEGALNRQLDGDHVADHVDAVKLTMDVGQILGDVEYEVAEVLAPIALQADSARFNAGVPEVDHAAFGEEADEPGDIKDAALRRVVGVPHDCFIVMRRHLAFPATCLGSAVGQRSSRSPQSGASRRATPWYQPTRSSTAGRPGKAARRLSR